MAHSDKRVVLEGIVRNVKGGIIEVELYDPSSRKLYSHIDIPSFNDKIRKGQYFKEFYEGEKEMPLFEIVNENDISAEARRKFSHINSF